MKVGKILFNSDFYSFSQVGEDKILNNYFNNKQNGFYVDIGCYHPIILSNTYFFHTFNKWKGINVDANSSRIILFNKFRPNDLNLEFGITEEKGVKDFL